MTNQDMITALKGTTEQKAHLYDYFFAKVSQGEVLEDNEVPIFEAVRKQLTKKPPEIVLMSGSATGSSGAAL